MIHLKEDLEKIWSKSLEYKIQQKKYEWIKLLEVINDRDMKFKNCLEIGAYDGGSSISLAHFCENMLTIDGNSPLRFNIDPIKELTNYQGVSANSFHKETLDLIKNFSKKFPTVVLCIPYSSLSVNPILV